MEPIAVAAALLREVVPEITLRPGASMLARVASRGEHHGVLVLAGMPLTAELPDDVVAGATLRLRVEEVSPERVVLRVDPQPAAPVAAPIAPPPQSRPAQVTVQEPPARRARPGDRPADVVALSFTAPTLGRLDLRLELRGGELLAAIEAPAGAGFDRARAAQERLRATLKAHGFETTVRVTPRHDPVDVYA